MFEGAVERCSAGRRTASSVASYSLWSVTAFHTAIDLLIIDREKVPGLFQGKGFPSTAEDSAELEVDFQLKWKFVSNFCLDL